MTTPSDSPASGELSAEDQEHLEHAIRLAAVARARGDHPFGAIVVSPDGAIVEGLNSVVTQRDPTGHAETNLVRAAGAALDPELLARATLFTSTEPCAMCSGAIDWAGIPRLGICPRRGPASLYRRSTGGHSDAGTAVPGGVRARRKISRGHRTGRAARGDRRARRILDRGERVSIEAAARL